jgi:hypothetical protein
MFTGNSVLLYRRSSLELRVEGRQGSGVGSNDMCLTSVNEIQLIRPKNSLMATQRKKVKCEGKVVLVLN